MKVKEGILVHASKILDPEFQVVNQNKSKVMMPASFLNNQSAGTVATSVATPVPSLGVVGASMCMVVGGGHWYLHEVDQCAFSRLERKPTKILTNIDWLPEGITPNKPGCSVWGDPGVRRNSVVATYQAIAGIETGSFKTHERGGVMTPRTSQQLIVEA